MLGEPLLSGAESHSLGSSYGTVLFHGFAYDTGSFFSIHNFCHTAQSHNMLKQQFDWHRMINSFNETLEKIIRLLYDVRTDKKVQVQ